MTWTEPTPSVAEARWGGGVEGGLAGHTGTRHMSQLVSRAEGGAHGQARAADRGGGTASTWAGGAWRSPPSAQPEHPRVRQKQVFPPIKNKF